MSDTELVFKMWN